MWLLAEDFIELTNSNKNNTKMMTMNHWKSFIDTKEDKKVELLKIIGQLSLSSFL
jgi:hypothetical protein